MAIQMLGMLAAALSFGGLCAAVRHGLRMDEAIAPFMAACFSIVVLMIAGVAGVMRYAWWALYIGGFIGLIVCLVRRRLRPGWCALALVLAAAYGWYHFHGAYFTGNDSVSHWGLVARHLLLNDRLPGREDALVFFKSYPTGSAAFIYYLLRGVKLPGAMEGYGMMAQFLLTLICLLPAWSLARKNRLLGAVIVGGLALTSVFVIGKTTSLQVDGLLGCVTLGGLASAARYRKKPGRALLATLLAIMALPLIKASGVLFAVLVLLADVVVAKRRRGWGRAIAWLAIGLLAAGAMFLMWQMHVRHTFGVENIGKHGLSLESYAEKSAGKSWAEIRSILVRLAKWFVWPDAKLRYIRLAWLGLFALGFLAARFGRTDDGGHIKALGRLFIASLAFYLAWYAMMLLVYVFSMPTEEALILASIDRYEGTVLIIGIGSAALFLIDALCDGKASVRGLGGVACAVLIAALVCAPLAGTGSGRALARKIVKPEASRPEPYGAFLDIERQGGIEPGKTCLAFCRHSEKRMFTMYYFLKYEMRTTDIAVLSTDINERRMGMDFDLDGYYLFDDIKGVEQLNVTQVEDLEGFLADNLDKYDYVICFSEDAAFEAALDGYIDAHDARTRVIRAI